MRANISRGQTVVEGRQHHIPAGALSVREQDDEEQCRDAEGEVVRSDEDAGHEPPQDDCDDNTVRLHGHLRLRPDGRAASRPDCCRGVVQDREDTASVYQHAAAVVGAAVGADDAD